MGDERPLVAIVILQWNNEKDTIECLQSISSIHYPNYRTFVVDNGSEPEAIRSIQGAFPQVTVIQNGKNLGFAAGNNRGMEEALAQGADYILLLNNDTTVDPALLTELVKAAESHPKAGVFGAKIFYYDDPTVIWYAGGNVNLKKGLCYHQGCTESELEHQHDQVKETGYACGCALFVKREVIEKVGLMSPEYFLLWEEIDWCWRIRKAGYSCLFVPGARVWHKISRSFKEGHKGPLWKYFYSRNRLLFIARHFTRSQQLKFFATTLLKEIVHLSWNSIKPQQNQQLKAIHRAALKGTRDYFLNRF